jgi:hypothetical protein
MAKCSTSKRELIDTGRNKMFAKRDAQGNSRRWTMWADLSPEIAGELPRRPPSQRTGIREIGREPRRTPSRRSS